MGYSDSLLHALNFAAPALAVALFTVFFSRLVLGKRGFTLAWWAQAAIIFIVNLLVLLAGLWFFERDGKMASYVALVICAASTQWLVSRSWR